MLKFDNVYHLLSWYFKRKWHRGPKLPGNHRLAYVDAITPLLSAKTVFDTIIQIDEVILKFPPRNLIMLEMLFTGCPMRDISEHLGLTDRRIRQIRKATIHEMRVRFELTGLFGGEHFYSEVRLATPNRVPLPAS